MTTREIIDYTIDGRCIPAIKIRGARALPLEEMLIMLNNVPCAWARINGHKRVGYYEAQIDGPTYLVAVEQDGLKSASKTPAVFHLLQETADFAKQSKNDVQFGDVFIIHAKRLFSDMEGAFVLQMILAIVPWFATERAFDGQTQVAWSLVIPNMNPMFLIPAETRSMLRCEKILPLMPFGDARLSPDKLHTMARKMLAFLLRWNQTCVAIHPELVKMGIRACERTRVANETKRLELEVELWRNAQQTSALNSRSFRFFGEASPRLELFASPFCWETLLHIVSVFAAQTLANFVISEVLDVLRFIVREEVLVHGELAVHQFIVGYLKEMCEGISEAEIASLKRQRVDVPASITSTTDNVLIFVSYFTELNAERLRRAETEPLDMRVETIGELRAQLAKRDDDATLLDEEQIKYLASINPADDKFDVNVERAMPENMIRNIVVVSHNFFCGIPQLTDVLYPPEFNTVHKTIVKGGRRYIAAGTAIETAILLTRAFLQWHTNIDANGSTITPLEQEFAKATPKGHNLYPSETHSTYFDDIALGTDDFRATRLSFNSNQLREFLSGRAGSLDLPADFNMARSRGLLVPTEYIIRGVPRTGTLHSARSGPIEVHQLALHTICHREHCYRKRARSDAPADPRAHIDIEYDTNSDSAARFERLTRLEASMKPFQIETLAAAVRAAAGGNREKLDDIEDVVGNMYENNALPLCVRKLAQPIQHKIGIGYHMNTERKILYRLLRSFDAPELTPAAIMRFMFKNSPAHKIGEHFSEAVTGWEKLLEKSHKTASDGYTKMSVKNMREVTTEEALAATTCAPSCSTMIGWNKTCPFLASDEEVYQMLLESGVSDSDAYRILARRGNAGLQCKMQFQMSRPGATGATRAFTQLTDDTFFNHPHQYMLAAADYLLRQEESKAEKK